MNITNIIRVEHDVFKAQFEQIEYHIRSLKSAGEVRSQVRVLAAPLIRHCRLEEALIYKPVSPFICAGDFEASAQYSHQHRHGHDEIYRLFDYLEKVEYLDLVRDVLSQIIAVSREHFAWEEQVLLPITRQILDANTLTWLGDQWHVQRKATTISVRVPQDELVYK